MLTAKDRDQLRNPTLGSRVWATFYLFTLRYYIVKVQYIEAVYIYLPVTLVRSISVLLPLTTARHAPS